MKKLILIFLGIFLATLGVNVYNQGSANSEKKSANAAKSVSKSSILEEIASIVANKISPSTDNKKKSSSSDSTTSKASSKENICKNQVAEKKESLKSNNANNAKDKIKKDLSLSSSLLNACPDYSSSQSSVSSEVSTETILGVKKKSLVCKNGNYQECLETCFADLICDQECPCLNACYNNCKSFISCGQWSSSDIIAELVSS